MENEERRDKEKRKGIKGKGVVEEGGNGVIGGERGRAKGIIMLVGASKESKLRSIYEGSKAWPGRC